MTLARPIAGLVAPPLGGDGLPWSDGGGKPPAPVNTVAPVASGTVLPGEGLTTTDGTWTGVVTSYEYQWQRAEVNIDGATTFSYSCFAEDCVVLGVRCGVRAVGPGGTSAYAYSNVLTFVPTNITGCRLWLRADMGVTLVGADVDAWADQSGIGNNFGVVSSTFRPLFIASAVNGQPAVQFDGVSERMRIAAFSLGGTTNPHSVFMVRRGDTFVSNDHEWAYGSNRPTLRHTTGEVAGYFGGSNATESVGTTDLFDSNFYLVGGTWNGGTQRLYVKGIQEDSDANASAAVADGGTLGIGAANGPSNWGAITVAEVLVYNAEITTDAISALNVYKVSRYGGT